MGSYKDDAQEFDSHQGYQKPKEYSVFLMY